MKKAILLIVVSIIVYTSSFATVRRINYWGSQTQGVDYTNFDSVQAASAAGDTVYVYPGSSIQARISKKLVVIGTGYMHYGTNGNANLQYISSESSLAVTWRAGSEGSVVQGIKGPQYFDGVGIKNILIKRCYITTIGWLSAGNNAATNIQFVQCYLELGLSGGLLGSQTFTNCLFSNCIFTGFSNSTSFNSTSSGVMDYCFFQDNGGYPLNFNGSSFTVSNSIFLSGPQNYTSTVFNYCLFGAAGVIATIAGTGNVVNTSNATWFVGYPTQGTNSPDGRWRLAAASPAATVGAGGNPIGPFAGADPYRLSGVPNIPAIYNVSSAGGTTPGGTITISVGTRGNN